MTFTKGQYLLLRLLLIILIGVSFLLPGIVAGQSPKTAFPGTVNNAAASLAAGLKNTNSLDSAVKGKMTSAIKKLKDDFNLKTAIRIDSFYTLYESQGNRNTDTINWSPSESYFQTGRAQFNASVFRVPLTMRYQYQQMNGWPLPGNLSAPVMDFNRALFTKSLSDRVRSSFDPSSLVGERLAAIQNLKDISVKDLKDDLLKAVNGYEEDIRNKVKQMSNWEEIMNGDTLYFARKVLGEKALEKMKQNEQLVARAQEKMNNHENIDTTVYQAAMKDIQKAKDLQKAVGIVMKYKKKWNESGLVKLIKRMELEKDLQLKEILNNPSILSKLAKDKLPLQKLEKLFLGVNKLQAGTGANDMSPLTLSQSLRSNGFSLETMGKGLMGGASVTMGKLQDLSSVVERSMAQGSHMNSTTSMAGISFGGNAGQQDQFSKISLMSFASSSAGNGTNMLSPFSGSVARNIVFTISRKMKIGSKGTLFTEISKSAAQQQNENKQGTGAAGNSFSLSNLFNTSDFFSNLGLSAEYANEFPEINLAHEFGFSYTGNGYSNQGNMYLLSGSKEIYNSLDKSFLKQKLVVRLKNRFKSYSLDNSGKHLNQFSNTLDVRWKFKKGNYVALRYQPTYSASTLGDGVKQNAVFSNRIAADLNIRTKIKKMQVSHFMNLAYLSTKTSFMGLADEVYKTIQLTTSHAVMKGSNQFFVNSNFNYAFKNGSLPFLNSSLLFEGGIAYDVFKVCKFSTACNYNMVDGWYSQVVLKQSVGGQLGKKLELNASIDVAKNIKVSQPYPVQNFRSDITVRYLIF